MSQAGDSLTRQLEALAPRSILAVGEKAAALIAPYRDSHPDCEYTPAASDEEIRSLTSAPPEQRYDFGLVAGHLETADPKSGATLLARLRDVLVRRLCVVIRDDDPAPDRPWSDLEMKAFGLSLLERRHEEDAVYRIYGFDIASYKRTPDWLSPRHWAHPERWNKERW
ncbi:MAG: DUF6231 family protein [Gammaproteobacteria bacterium]|nr:DUF6231 family protein [Gammaproteobacteria bacterium]